MRLIHYALLLVFMCYSSVVASAIPLGKIDFGVGLGGQHLNDYRGSKESQTNALPFPIIIYTGKYLTIDEEEGVRTDIWQTHRFELNVSADTSLRSSSDENALREGMPILNTALELGPSFNVLLIGVDFDDGLTLRFPLRGVMAVNLSDWGVDYVGYTFSPELTYKKTNILPRWNLKVTAGPIYGSRLYHDYYYSIDQKYANSKRVEYRSKDGYGGFFSELGLFSQYGNWLFKLNLRYDDLSGAEFLASDLVETEHYFSASFGVGWLLKTHADTN